MLSYETASGLFWHCKCISLAWWFFFGCFHIIQLCTHSELRQLNAFWEVTTTIITFIEKFYRSLRVFHTMLLSSQALFHCLFIIILKSRHWPQFDRWRKWGFRFRELNNVIKLTQLVLGGAGFETMLFADF